MIRIQSYWCFISPYTTLVNDNKLDKDYENNYEEVLLPICGTQMEDFTRLRLSGVRFTCYKCCTGRSLVAKSYDKIGLIDN